jgi:glycerate 2-kinase
VNRTSLQNDSREIFKTALAAVDARAATQSAVTLDNSLLKVGDTEIDISGRPIYLIAIGKASAAMTSGFADVLGDRITRGIVCGPPDQDVDPHSWRRFTARFTGGHPLPTEESILAAKSTLSLLADADERTLIFFLISGGGSAMFELPVQDSITIDDLREANRQLVSCGASIAEINAVRRAFSAVKGGKLALAAPHSDQITLIVSDTNSDDAASVASGPTIEPDFEIDAIEVVKRYAVENSLPRSIRDAIAEDAPERHATGRLRTHYVLLDNNTALNAAAGKAQEMGFAVEVAKDINEQEIDAGCDSLLSLAQDVWKRNGGKPVCLLSGGEFSCRVRGDGIGGRNLETVLRFALKMKELPSGATTPHWTILSAGTDGIDGNSEAAGAMADETTVLRANERNITPAEFLERSDSFHFFEQLGDAIVTGATGTNVRDIRVVLFKARPPE